MKLLELRYRKGSTVDRIMAIVDDLALGGNEYIANAFEKYGINPNEDPDLIQKQLMMMDEFKVMRLYRALIGGK